MQEYFGPITPFIIIGVVTALTQFTKQWAKLEGWRAALVAFGWSFLLVAPYHILIAVSADALVPFTFYEALLYTILAALTSAGLYSVTRTLFGERDGSPK